MKVRVYHNGDDVFIAWKPEGFIPTCRGFALLRRRNGVEEVVSTWVGFEDDEHEEGERRASTNWPIQKYQWTDYMAAPGDKVQYRVLADGRARTRGTCAPTRHGRATGPTRLRLPTRSRRRWRRTSIAESSPLSGCRAGSG